MIRDAVERVFSVVSANFNAEFAALATAAGVPSVTADFYKRQAAEIFSLKTTAGLGIYHDGGSAQTSEGGAAGSRRRTATVIIVLDWWIQGSDPDIVAQQTEIAVDAALRTVDRLVGFDQASGVGGAAVTDDSFSWRVERVHESTEQGAVMERAVMRFPIQVRDEGLQ